MGSPRPQCMSQAVRIDAPKRNNKYMANPTNLQVLFRKNLFFVNYVKILCKQSYVNYVDRPRFVCLKSAQIPISGENRKIPAPYIETGKTTDGSPAARRLVKRKMRKKRFRYFNHAPLYVTARFRRLPP